MTLEELARALAEQFGTDSAAVLAALQAHANPVYTAVWNSGHKQAASEGKTKLTELKNQVKELEEKAEGLEGTVTELRAKAPDAAKLQGDYQKEIDNLKNKHKGEVERLKGSIESERRTRTMADLRTKLVSSGVDPDYAEVIVQKPDLVSRIRFDESGNVQVMQPGKDIPYAPDGAIGPVDTLAKELADATPAKFRTSTVDKGGDARARSGGAAGGKAGGGATTDLGKIRESVLAERAGKSNPTTQAGTAADRLAGRRPVPAADTK